MRQSSGPSLRLLHVVCSLPLSGRCASLIGQSSPAKQLSLLNPKPGKFPNSINPSDALTQPSAFLFCSCLAAAYLSTSGVTFNRQPTLRCVSLPTARPACLSSAARARGPAVVYSVNSRISQRQAPGSLVSRIRSSSKIRSREEVEAACLGPAPSRAVVAVDCLEARISNNRAPRPAEDYSVDRIHSRAAVVVGSLVSRHRTRIRTSSNKAPRPAEVCLVPRIKTRRVVAPLARAFLTSLNGRRYSVATLSRPTLAPLGVRPCLEAAPLSTSLLSNRAISQPLAAVCLPAKHRMDSHKRSPRGPTSTACSPRVRREAR